MTTTPTASFAERVSAVPPPPTPPPRHDVANPNVDLLNRKLADLRHQKERIDIAIAVVEEIRAEMVGGTPRSQPAHDSGAWEKRPR